MAIVNCIWNALINQRLKKRWRPENHCSHNESAAESWLVIIFLVNLLKSMPVS